jgi:carboxylate-amine ligase
MRTFGVEEELLLVDQATHSPVAVAGYVLGRDEGHERVQGDVSALTAELQQEMIEAVTSPADSAAELRAQIAAGRSRADAGARGIGARAAALATSPLAVLPHTTPQGRYQEMARRYGMTTRRTLVCGCHVHVSIDSPDEGVAVLDRARVWLPVLLALSGNSPFADGEDTGYASFRSIAWLQWPSSGPTPVFGSAARYRDYASRLLSTGVLMDEGMLYFDARLARAYPTVEVRIADICATVETATMLATLVRALVETAANEWRDGVAAPDTTIGELRLDKWQAGLAGLTGELVHPIERRRMPAADVLAALVEHVRPALDQAGDTELVTAGIATLLAGGTGAERQRAVLRREGSLGSVVDAAVEWTNAAAAPTQPAVG